MRNQNIIMERAIARLLEERKYLVVKDILITMLPGEIAGIFRALKSEQIPVLFRLLPKELAAKTFVKMDPEEKELLIRGFSDSSLREVLDELYAGDAADLIEEMPANVVKRILDTAGSDMRRSVNELLKYPDNSAGSIMTTEFIRLAPNMSISECISSIRNSGVNSDTIYTCFITENGVLKGRVTVKDLLLAADDDLPVRNIMDSNIAAVTTLNDQEEVAALFNECDLPVIPVVDRENRLVGVVMFDDAMEIMEEEATEDMEIMGGMSPSEKNYIRSSVFDLFRQRIPWLMLLMISATFTGMIITGFETALAAQVALTAFIPMLMDTGGNSGSQSSVTVIRAISLGEIKFSDLPMVLWKELRTAVLCGASLSAVCFLKIILIDRMLLGNEGITLAVAAVVCFTLIITVFLAKSVGAVLPLAASRMGFDPAVMSSPFITTIVDALSLLVYFETAKILLGL